MCRFAGTAFKHPQVDYSGKTTTRELLTINAGSLTATGGLTVTGNLDVGGATTLNGPVETSSTVTASDDIVVWNKFAART